MITFNKKLDKYGNEIMPTPMVRFSEAIGKLTITKKIGNSTATVFLNSDLNPHTLIMA